MSNELEKRGIFEHLHCVSGITFIYKSVIKFSGASLKFPLSLAYGVRFLRAGSHFDKKDKPTYADTYDVDN